MNKRLMTDSEINEMIEFEDRCGVNTLLQEIFLFEGRPVNVYGTFNDSGVLMDYTVEERVE